MKIRQVVALALAGIIGIMSVTSGSLVLLDLKEVHYTVLSWLVVYNVVVGIFSVITALLIWKNFPISKRIIVLILCSHAAVLFYLGFFSQTVADESIMAMIFRVVVWLLIFFLAYRIKFTTPTAIQTKKS